MFFASCMCVVRDHTCNGLETAVILWTLFTGLTPSLHVHSGHSPETSRSYCWAVLLHIQKSANKLNITFLDILRWGSWEKSGSPRVLLSHSSDDDDLHQNTSICIHIEGKTKEWILLFLASPQVKWKKEQKHVMCLKVAKSRQPRIIPKRPLLKVPSPNAGGKGKEKTQKGRRKYTTEQFFAMLNYVGFHILSTKPSMMKNLG